MENKECKNKKCSKEVSWKDEKCPHCKTILKQHVTAPYNQKKWFGYLNENGDIVDHMICVKIDYYDDSSIKIEIPLLKVRLDEKEKVFLVFNKADDLIKNYLKESYGKTYDNEHKFVTVAFHLETEDIKHNIPVWWKKKNEHPQNYGDGSSH